MDAQLQYSDVAIMSKSEYGALTFSDTVDEEENVAASYQKAGVCRSMPSVANRQLKQQVDWKISEIDLCTTHVRTFDVLA